ncbi:alpha-L-fucosidase [Wenyingzhuangia sp. IMCC45574]
MEKSKLLLIAVFSFVNFIVAQKYTATKESLSQHKKVPEWYKDSKLGIYFHWGPYCVPAYGGEWYPRWMYTSKESGWGSGWKEYHEKTYGKDFNYHQFIPDFTGENFDANEWAKLFKATGAKFAGPVAQHHDGFAMWDSEINPYNAKDKGPKQDIVGLMLAALRKENLKTITTLHHAFTFKHEKRPTYYNISPEYATSSNDSELRKLYGNMPVEEGREYWLALTNELVDKYKPDLLWFDSDLDRMPWKYRLEMTSHFFNTSVENAKQTAIIAKQKDLPPNVRILDVERGGLKGMPQDYWMTDITISDKGKGWGYINGQTYKKTGVILKNMIDTWSKKGVVLLNISPDKTGTINKEQRAILKEIGDWIQTHQEAIYNTRTHDVFGYGTAEIHDGSHGGQSSTIEYTEEDVRFTKSKDGKYLYVFLLGQPKKGTQVELQHVVSKGDSVRNVSFLDGEQLKWETKEDLLKVTIPKNRDLDGIATVFKVEL